MGKRTKKLLSLLTAAAISASAFAGLTMSAGAFEAADSKQDFESGDTWGFVAGTSATVVDEANADPANKYLQFATNVGTDYKYLADEIKQARVVDVSFKWRTSVDTGAGGGRGAMFELLDSDGNVILCMYGASNRSQDRPTRIRYAVGQSVSNTTTQGTPLADLPNTWFDVDVSIDFANGTISGKITDSQNAVTTIEKTSISAKNLAELRATGLASNAAAMGIDDVEITENENVVPVTFTVTSTNNSEPVGNAVISVANTEITTSADGTAVLNLPEGEYTASVVAANHFEKNDVAVNVSGASVNVPITLEYVDNVYADKIVITQGDAKIYKPASGENKTTTPYTAVVYNNINQIMENEPVTWSIDNCPDGASIDQDGYITVTDAIDFADDNGVPLTVRATVTNYDTVTDVVRDGTQVLNVARVTTFDLAGPLVIKDGTSAEYSATNIKDQYGADMTSGYGELVLSTTASDLEIDGAAVTANAGVTTETTRTINATLDGVVAEKTVTVYGYDFYEPGIDEASYGTPRMETINGQSMIVWPASQSGTATTTITLPVPVELKGAKMFTFENIWVDNTVGSQERSFKLMNAAGQTILYVGYAGGSVITNPVKVDGSYTTGEGGITIGAMGGTGAVNTGLFVFTTGDDGKTRATLTYNGGESKEVDLGENLGEIASIQLIGGNGAPNSRMLSMINMKISDSNIAPVEIFGDNYISRISDRPATKQYEASVFSREEGEVFAWSVGDENGAAITGVSISEDGVLSVDKDVEAGTKVYVKYGSTSNPDKYAEKEVTVNDWADVASFEIDGPAAVSTGQSATYAVINIVDEHGDAVDLPVTYSITGDNLGATEPAKYTFSGIDSTVTEGTLIHAYYNGDVLESVDEIKTVDIVDGTYSVVPVPKEGLTEKYLLWNAIDGDGSMVPLATAEYVPARGGIASIDPVTGVLTTSGNGKIKVVATVGNPGKTKTIEKEVEIAQFYYTNESVSGESLDVNVSELANYSADTQYYVTTVATDGTVTQTETGHTNGTVTINTTGISKVEVSPIYSYSDVGSVRASNPLVIPVCDGLYNFDFKKSDGSRGDIYVNGVIVGNNIDQNGKLRTNVGAEYSVADVPVSGGAANVYIDASGFSTVKVKKTPTIIERKKHIYILGDSLVCYYNGNPTSTGSDGYPTPGTAQTGWGQVFANFIKDDVNVTNLAESGNYAQGLYNSVFKTVIANAYPGDVLLFEVGYNDRNYPAELGSDSARYENMKNYMELAYNEATEKGIEVIFVTPNASAHGTGWKSGVQGTGHVIEKSDALGAKYINLSGISYAFLEPKGIDWTTNNFNVQGDTLHSAFFGAMKCAEIVAQELHDIDGYSDWVDTTKSYTLTDNAGESYILQVK